VKRRVRFWCIEVGSRQPLTICIVPIRHRRGLHLQSAGDLRSKNLALQLEACEANLRIHHRLAMAGTLIGATMHEVNNRLEALTNYVYLARNADSVVNSGSYLNAAGEELRRIGEITSRGLAFVRTDLEAKSIDLIELANVALQLHREKISSKRVNVQLRMAESAIAHGRRGEVLQVLVNLLLNALDALPHSGNLHVRVASRRDEVIITIADNGVGIPEGIRSSIFQSLKSSKEQGNGLGLWVVKQIVDSHNGRISYRSSTRAHQSGTAFRVALPVLRVGAGL
jgi:signal transduction histidine kinase